MSKARAFLRDTAGATAVEYGVLVTCIALALLAVMTTVGSKISGKLSYLGNTFS